MKFIATRMSALIMALTLAACAGHAGSSITPDASGRTGGPIKPMDTYGGTTGISLLGLVKISLLDSSPSLNGKTVAHFYIGVDEIDAMASSTAYPLVKFGSPYVLDLLQYQNGASLPMAQISIPAQTYNATRMVLDTASAQVVFSDGSSLPVSFKATSSQSSAHAAAGTNTTTDPNIAGAVDVTVNAPFSVDSGSSASLAADFNALESLTINNNNVFVRPSLFVANGAPGMITGTIVNSSGSPVQNAVVVATGSSGQVANTSATDANGNFNLHALQAGTYQLTIYNSYTTAAGQPETANGQTSAATSVSGPTVTVTAGGSASTGSLND
jgi:Carboxypeptidase regulatory-like domain/Domain of unknown function (DUF4382)